MWRVSGTELGFRFGRRRLKAAALLVLRIEPALAARLDPSGFDR